MGWGVEMAPYLHQYKRALFRHQRRRLRQEKKKKHPFWVTERKVDQQEVLFLDGIFCSFRVWISGSSSYLPFWSRSLFRRSSHSSMSKEHPVGPPMSVCHVFHNNGTGGSIVRKYWCILMGPEGSRCCATATSDHICATMTNVVCHKEHLWNVSVFQRGHLSNLFLFLSFLTQPSSLVPWKGLFPICLDMVPSPVLIPWLSSANLPSLTSS
jgi:hypothetical protein